MSSVPIARVFTKCRYAKYWSITNESPLAWTSKRWHFGLARMRSVNATDGPMRCAQWQRRTTKHRIAANASQSFFRFEYACETAGEFLGQLRSGSTTNDGEIACTRRGRTVCNISGRNVSCWLNGERFSQLKTMPSLERNTPQWFASDEKAKATLSLWLIQGGPY